jgi:hypothetical protein
LVYDAYLALDVGDPETEAGEAVRIAQDYGGYLVNSYTGNTNGQAAVTLEFRLPPGSFEAALRSFRGLGIVLRETVSGEWIEDGSGWEPYARIIIFLGQKRSPFNLGEEVGWNPGETLRQALVVSARLVGFFVDLLIWGLVVLGPFVSVILGIAWITKRSRGSWKTPGPALENSKSLENNSKQGGYPHE